MEEIRLNKWLGEMGFCSRREADRLVAAGKITVDGKLAVTGMKVSQSQEIRCNGILITNTVKPVLLAVNKPRGIVCTTSKKDKAPNIVELINYPQRVYPVGRLDKESEGLILMTNQGDLVNKIMRSGNSHEKEYIVTVDHPLTSEFIEKMRAGVYLKELERMTFPCQLDKIGDMKFRIILTQGLNRQIRRMCLQLGYQVNALKRVRIMNIMLGQLKSGSYRNVTPEEYQELIQTLENSTNLSYKESYNAK